MHGVAGHDDPDLLVRNEGSLPADVDLLAALLLVSVHEPAQPIAREDLGHDLGRLDERGTSCELRLACELRLRGDIAVSVWLLPVCSPERNQNEGP